MVDIPSFPHRLPPAPPPTPREPAPKVFFFLQFSQAIQSLQNAHHPDHPQYEEIQNSAGNLHKILTDNESKIKGLCVEKGWSTEETNENHSQCLEDLKLAQKASADNPVSLESAQSSSKEAETIFNHINPS